MHLPPGGLHREEDACTVFIGNSLLKSSVLLYMCTVSGGYLAKTVPIVFVAKDRVAYRAPPFPASPDPGTAAL